MGLISRVSSRTYRYIKKMGNTHSWELLNLGKTKPAWFPAPSATNPAPFYESIPYYNEMYPRKGLTAGAWMGKWWNTSRAQQSHMHRFFGNFGLVGAALLSLYMGKIWLQNPVHHDHHAGEELPSLKLQGNSKRPKLYVITKKKLIYFLHISINSFSQK